MATIIEQVPSIYTPAFNPMYCLISGNNWASSNYELVVDIKNPSGDILARLKNPTDPTYQTKAAFDIHRVIESYLSHTIDLAISKVSKAVNNIYPYNIITYEQYGSPAALYLGSETFTKYALNIALSPQEWLSWNDAEYLTGSATRKFLNKFKGARKLFTTTKAFLYFLQNEAFPVNSIGVDAYDINDVNIANSRIIQSYGGSGSTNYEHALYVPSGPTNLNLIPQAELSLGTSGSVIPAQTSYYKMSMQFGAFAGEVLTFSIIENCSKYTNYTIYFLGQYGNFEVWNFNRRSDSKSNINRSNYRAALGKFLTSSTYGYEIGDRQATQYNTEVQDGLILNTDLLTEAELLFLKECVQSPCVFILDGANLIPVIITDNVFEEKKKANEKLFNLSITVEYASITQLQRY